MKQILSQIQIQKLFPITTLVVSCLLPALISALALAGLDSKLDFTPNSIHNFAPLSAQAPTLPDNSPTTGGDATILDSSSSDDSGNDESDEQDGSDEDDLDLYDFPYPLIIRAVHPGYEIDSVSDVGELIELQNLSDAPLSLAGFSLRYTNGTGNKTVTIFEFAEGSLMTGETLLLRYHNKKLETQDPADLYYASSLAFSAGPLVLVAEDGTEIDSVCWNGKSGCVKAFNSKKPTILVRNLFSGDFEHKESYESGFDPANPSYYAPPTEDLDQNPEDDPNETESAGTPQCFALEFSEIYSYYVSDQSEQFIEFYNPTLAAVSLDGCQLRYKKKLYPLSGTIAPDSYFAFYPGKLFSLTKNPSSSVLIELVDADENIVEEISYPKGQKKSTSYARIYNTNGAETWVQTYAITPSSDNIYQEYRTCEAGKAINPLTGNCVKVSSLTTTPTICPEGKYLNPLTGRCKSITSATSTLKPCAEGYERNPETNRCRKIVSANDGAEHALVPNTRSDSKAFIAAGVVALLVASGIIYIVLQFRREIARMVRKIRQRFNRVLQDLLAGKISLHRNKKP